MSNVTKRSVSTDALETLGTVIDEKEKRDAIHLAVIPVYAGEKLYPGQSFMLVKDSALADRNGLGIVDPFLSAPVYPGDRFWMILRPRLVTSLRHVWSHPEFPDEEGTPNPKAPEGVAALTPDVVEIVNVRRNEAVKVVQATADEFGVEYDELMQYAKEYLETGHYQVEGSRWMHGVGDEFWDAYELVTGTRVNDRGGIFSCSC